MHDILVNSHYLYKSYYILLFIKLAFSMVILKLEKDIEKQASTRVILRSAFQIARSRFCPLKPLLKTHYFSEKSANFTK